MRTETVARIAGLRDRVAEAKGRGLVVGCVPTMGALHAAHTSLFDRACVECGFVVATIFVNPLQFDQPDDLRSYPRDIDTDLQVCSDHGVDVAFVPSAEEMYPRPPVATVEIAGLAEGLCGASRPGHFRGVATVVLKLLNIVQPDVAYFGEKDFQQLVIIRRLVEDTCVPVRIASIKTVREEDGLALSSRNALLSSDERTAALNISKALQEAERRVAKGDSDAPRIRQRAAERIEREPLLRLDYFEIVDPETLRSVERVAGPVRIAAAAFAGGTRLIDNVSARPPEAR